MRKRPSEVYTTPGDPSQGKSSMISTKALCTLCLAAVWQVSPVSAADRAAGTIRVGTPTVAESLDPARANDLDAMSQAAAIYDTLYAFDPLARPAAIVPQAAEALPEVSADYRTFVIRVRPGIHFSPHPRLEAGPRELVAADFAYAFRRVFDPKIRSPWLSFIEGKIEGLDALAQEARAASRGIDYEAPIAGLVVVDRYTLRIRLNSPDPLFPMLLTNPLFAGVAREVVEAEGAGYGHRPVGTGAFLVASFTPGNRLVLVRNPRYRRVSWDDLLTPASRAANPGHPMRGRTLPAFDRVEISSTPEAASELLALRRGELEVVLLSVPQLAIRSGRLRAEIEKDGVRLVHTPISGTLTVFLNMRDPVVGGDAPHKIALRRALLMAFDDEDWIRIEGGIAIARQQVVPPGIEGHVPGYRSPNMFAPVAANALLDRFGYRRDIDGFRRHPDGSTLTLKMITDNTSKGRQRGEFTKRMLDRVGIRVAIETVALGEFLKRLANCRHGLAWSEWWLDFPDGINPMLMFYGKAIGSFNLTCHADAAFDAAYEKAQAMPAGPARTELFRAMQTRLDSFGLARPLPFSDVLLLKRAGVQGPFSTQTDWARFTTLGQDP